MASQLTKMTRKGQVTIPAEIRSALDLHEGDQFIVRQEDHRVVLERASDRLRSAKGALAKYAMAVPPSPEDEQAAIEQAVVDDYLASLAQ